MDSPVPDARIVLARERPFRLGEVEVRPATREVIGPSGRETLEPRVMQVLVALARAGGDVVTRDDLTASCWEGRVVGEDAISRVISRLRRLTDGVGRAGWTLETVTKVGYRLLPAGLDPDDAPTAAPARRPPDRRALLAGGLAATAVAAGGGALYWTRRRPRVAPQVRSLVEQAGNSLRQAVPDQTAQGLGFAREAVQLAPDYAPAWGMLALAYCQSLGYTDPAHQPAVRAQARAAADRALELEPGEPAATTALTILEPFYRNWIDGERRVRQALARYPHHAQLESMQGALLLSVGRVRDSIPVLQASVVDDPFAPWSRYMLGRALWSAGRMEETALEIAKARARWPRHFALWFLNFDFLLYSGRPDQAIGLGEDRANWPVSVPRADIEMRIGDARALQTRAPADLAAAAEQNLAHARQGIGYAENAMVWMSAAGRLDDAFALARGIYLGEGAQPGAYRFSPENGRFTQPTQRNTHPLFSPPTAPMRADPRFADLARGIGLVDYWKTTGRLPDDPALRRLA